MQNIKSMLDFMSEINRYPKNGGENGELIIFFEKVFIYIYKDENGAEK